MATYIPPDLRSYAKSFVKRSFSDQQAVQHFVDQILSGQKTLEDVRLLATQMKGDESREAADFVGVRGTDEAALSGDRGALAARIRQIFGNRGIRPGNLRAGVIPERQRSALDPDRVLAYEDLLARAEERLAFIQAQAEAHDRRRREAIEADRPTEPIVRTVPDLAPRRLTPIEQRLPGFPAIGSPGRRAAVTRQLRKEIENSQARRNIADAVRKNAARKQEMMKPPGAPNVTELGPIRRDPKETVRRALHGRPLGRRFGVAAAQAELKKASR